MSILTTFSRRGYDARTDKIIAERERRHLSEMRHDLRHRWREACERPSLQLAHGVHTGTGFGPGRAPLITEIAIGGELGPTTFIVELRPGQILDDLTDAGRELAAALFCHKLRFDPIGGPYVRVTLVEDDPHVAITSAEPFTVADHLVVGVDEYGDPVAFTPAALPHVACQGRTRAGKSTLLYALLRQAVTVPGVRLAGVDPSGVLWRALPSDPLRVSGLSSIPDVVAVLESLVAEMDDRLGRLPWDDDRLPCGPDQPDPWLLIVLEELPGLLAALTSADRKTAEYVKLLIGRLAAESHKVGMRLIMAAQRFDANSTAGATVRSNCGLRISFSVENRAAVEFLHDDAGPDVVAQHVNAEPGVCLVSAPGAALRRVRTPHVTYQEWAYTGRLCRVYGPAVEPVAAAA
jgi:hypothetical protein